MERRVQHTIKSSVSRIDRIALVVAMTTVTTKYLNICSGLWHPIVLRLRARSLVGDTKFALDGYGSVPTNPIVHIPSALKGQNEYR